MKATLLALALLSASCPLLSGEPEATALFLGVATAQGSGEQAFERATTTDCLLGQVKLRPDNAVPSNCVWGLDVAINDDKADANTAISFKDENGVQIQVRSAEPLLCATQRLFGIRTQPRFPLPRTAIQEIAGRQHAVQGPCQIWAAFAVVRGEDKKSVIVASCGSCPKFKSDRAQMKYFETVMQELCGKAMQEAKDRNIACKDILASFRETWVPEGNFGCAVAAMPQMKLPKEAMPAGGLEKLYGMKLQDWESELKLPSLPPFEE